MADPHPRTAGVGPFVPPFPPPPALYRQGMPPPPPLPYPSVPHYPSALHGLSGTGQVHQHSQQQSCNIGPQFAGTPPHWNGYGFQGLTRNYGPQVPLPVAVCGTPTKSLPGLTTLAQNPAGLPGIGFDQQRNSFGVSAAHNVLQVANSGESTVLPPGIGSDNFRASSRVQLSQDISVVTSSGHSIVESLSSESMQVRSSNPGAAPLVVTQGSGVAAGTQSSATMTARPTDSGSKYENDQSANVVEVAMLQSPQEKSVDIKQVLLQIRSLVSQVERVAEQIGSLVKIDLGSIESLAVDCPFDCAHKIAPESLFQHYLRCPSNPRPPLNPQHLVDALNYRQRAIQGHSSSDISSAEEHSRRRQIADPTSELVSSSRAKFDIWGGQFFYDGASAVVQAPLYTLYPPPRNLPPSPVIEVPGRVCKILESREAVETTATRRTSASGDALLLLPSRYFFLSREIEAWKVLPSRSSSLVIEAAITLLRVGKSTVVNWLLVNSPAHGIVIDSTLACNIYTLIKLCSKELYDEATAVIKRAGYKPVAIGSAHRLNDNDVQSAYAGLPKFSQLERTCDMQTYKSKTGDWVAERSFYPEIQFVDCRGVFQSVDWLSAQLSPLYGAGQSKAFCLKLLKHVLASSGRLLCSQFIDTFDRNISFPRESKVEDLGNDGSGALQNLEIGKGDSPPFEPPMVSDDLPRTEIITVRNASSLVHELEAAVAAVNERAVLELYLRTQLHANRLPNFQIIQEYQAATKLAAEERLKRPNYRPVLEFDGLIWHRSQLEEKNKNKTREEILAEERDYKRRRMSYRGKKLKRTPTQVVHDIIEAHMDEIVAAGGIGCFIKQSAQVLPSAFQQNVKDEISLASSDSSFAGTEQLRLPAPNPSSTKTIRSSQDVPEKGGGSHSHLETQILNKCLRTNPRERNISNTEDHAGWEAASKQYQLKDNDSATPYPRCRTEGADREYTDHDSGKNSGVNCRSTFQDHTYSSRIANEASKVRLSSHDRGQSERHYTTNRPRKSGVDTHESQTNEDIRDYRQRRSYRHDSHEDQVQNKSPYERYGDDNGRDEKRSRRSSLKAEDRKEETMSDKYGSDSEPRETSKSRQ